MLGLGENGPSLSDFIGGNAFVQVSWSQTGKVAAILREAVKLGGRGTRATMEVDPRQAAGLGRLGFRREHEGSSPSGSQSVQTLFISGRSERSVMNSVALSSLCLEEPCSASSASTLARMLAVCAAIVAPSPVTPARNSTPPCDTTADIMPGITPARPTGAMMIGGAVLLCLRPSCWWWWSGGGGAGAGGGRYPGGGAVLLVLALVLLVLVLLLVIVLLLLLLLLLALALALALVPGAAG